MKRSADHSVMRNHRMKLRSDAAKRELALVHAVALAGKQELDTACLKLLQAADALVEAAQGVRAAALKVSGNLTASSKQR